MNKNKKENKRHDNVISLTFSGLVSKLVAIITLFLRNELQKQTRLDCMSHCHNQFGHLVYSHTV
jgi:hypothetical protein